MGSILIRWLNEVCRFWWNVQTYQNTPNTDDLDYFGKGSFHNLQFQIMMMVKNCQIFSDPEGMCQCFRQNPMFMGSDRQSGFSSAPMVSRQWRNFPKKVRLTIVFHWDFKQNPISGSFGKCREFCIGSTITMHFDGHFGPFHFVKL